MVRTINYLKEYNTKYKPVVIDQWFWSLFKGEKVSVPKTGNSSAYKTPFDTKRVDLRSFITIISIIQAFNTDSYFGSTVTIVEKITHEQQLQNVNIYRRSWC